MGTNASLYIDIYWYFAINVLIEIDHKHDDEADIQSNEPMNIIS